LRGDARLGGARRFPGLTPSGGRPRAALRRRGPRLHPVRPIAEVARTKELEPDSLKERPSTHVEDPTIEQLAAAAGRTDELAVRRQLFGWRELISTVIPIALIAYFARNVDWSEAFATLRRADPLFVLAALFVYYLSFPVRAIRWARLLREGGARVFGRDLLEILLLGWFVNCLVPAKLGDLYRSYLVKRRFGISLSRTVGGVVAERLLDLSVVFGLLVVDGYVAFGRRLLPDPNVLYITRGGLGLDILIGLVALYAIGPRLGRFFPAEVR